MGKFDWFLMKFFTRLQMSQNPKPGASRALSHLAERLATQILNLFYTHKISKFERTFCFTLICLFFNVGGFTCALLDLIQSFGEVVNTSNYHH